MGTRPRGVVVRRPQAPRHSLPAVAPAGAAAACARDAAAMRCACVGAAGCAPPTLGKHAPAGAAGVGPGDAAAAGLLLPALALLAHRLPRPGGAGARVPRSERPGASCLSGLMERPWPRAAASAPLRSRTSPVLPCVARAPLDGGDQGLLPAHLTCLHPCLRLGLPGVAKATHAGATRRASWAACSSPSSTTGTSNGRQSCAQWCVLARLVGGCPRAHRMLPLPAVYSLRPRDSLQRGLIY